MQCNLHSNKIRQVFLLLLNSIEFKMKVITLSVIIFQLIVSSEIVGAQNPNFRNIMPNCTQPNPEFSCICLEIFDPQCGTNGVTYGNDCRLACAQMCDPKIMLAHKGPCNPPPQNPITPKCSELNCICPFIWDPVCGTDSVTYPNDCVLRCAQRCDPNLTLAHRGECGTSSTWHWAGDAWTNSKGHAVGK